MPISVSKGTWLSALLLSTPCGLPFHAPVAYSERRWLTLVVRHRSACVLAGESRPGGE
jgi:hypothetical protein